MSTENIFEQKDHTEYLVFHSLEMTELRTALAKWPLHITLLGPTQLSGRDGLTKLREIVSGIAMAHSAFYVHPGDRALFGPKENEEVTKILDLTGNLQLIHNKLLRGIGEIGCQNFDDRWSGLRFTPHVTDKGGKGLGPNLVYVNSLSICAKNRGQRQILETVTLA